MYQNTDVRLVSHLAQLLAPGGVISILAKNADALAYRSAAEGKFDEALALIKQRSTSVGRLHVATRAHTVKELALLLGKNGITLTGWFGVKIFCDHMTDTPDPESLQSLLALEYEASRCDPYRQSARLIHVLGRKTS